MNLILLAAQSSPALAELFPTRHSALLPVAGDAFLNHAVDLLAEAAPARWFVTLGAHGAEMGQWVAGRAWEREPVVIDLGEPAGFLPALSRSRDYLPDREPLLVTSSAGIFKADWSLLAGDPVALRAGDMVCALYLPRAEQLWPSVNRLLLQHESAGPAELAAALQTDGVSLTDVAATQWEEATTPEGLLQTNKRLLSVGYGTREALERSFAEGFAVLPPIYLADSAEVGSAVLGPYVSVGEGAVVEDAVLRNCIIAPGARVVGCVLDGAIVGANSEIVGTIHALRTGDGSQISLG